jgi:hypothetical protein
LFLQRWIFYINFFFLGASVVLVVLFLDLNSVQDSFVDKLRRVDYNGTTLFMGSIASFLIPITWSGVMYAWDSWRTLVPLVIGAVGLLVFAFYEYRFAAEPMIPHSLFQNRTSTVAFLGSSLQDCTTCLCTSKL